MWKFEKLKQKDTIKYIQVYKQLSIIIPTIIDVTMPMTRATMTEHDHSRLRHYHRRNVISFERLKIVVCNIFVCIFCRLLLFIYINLTFFGIFSSISMSKSLELDQTPSYSASDQATRCLQRSLQLRIFTLQRKWTRLIT